MEPFENSKEKETSVKKPGRKIFRRFLPAAAILLLIVLLVVIFAAPAFVSSGSFRKILIAKANAGGTGTVDFADLSMSWSKGIIVSGITFKDNAESVSVAVKGFSTKPRYTALLTGNLSFGETIINEPRVEIDIEKMKERPQDAGAEAGDIEQKPETRAALPIGRIDLVVKNGDVKIKGGSSAVEISQINSSVNLRPEEEKTDFNLAATIAGAATQSKVKAEGQIQPGRGWDFKQASGDATIEVNNLDLASLESLLAAAGVDINAKGFVTASIKAAFKEGLPQTLTGEVMGKNLDISLPQMKGDRIKTGILDAKISAAKTGDLMNVENLTLVTDWLKVEAGGAAPMTLATLEDFLKPGSQYELKANLECDIPSIVSQLRQTAGLREGMQITGGKLTAEVQTLTQDNTKKLSGQAGIESIAGTLDGKSLTISEPIRAQALFAADGKQIKFEKANVTSSFANITCSGTPEAFSYEAAADLDKLTHELGQFVDIAGYKLAGKVTGKGQISNNESTTMLVGSAKIENLRASPSPDITISEPDATLDVVAAIEKKTNLLLVKQFKAGTSLGQFSVKDGRILLAGDSREPIALTASAREVDLAKVQPYLVMSKAISKDIQLGGIVESDVTVALKDGVYKLKTGNTKISNLVIKSPEKAPFTQETISLVLDAGIDPAAKNLEANIELTGTNVHIKGNFTKKAEGNTADLQGNALLDYDWNTLSGMASAFMPPGLTIEGKRKDSVSFSSRYPANNPDAMLANLNAQGKVGFDKASYMGLNIGSTAVDVNVVKGLLTIAPFTTTVNNGRFNFGGTADFKAVPAMFRTPPNLRIVENVQLNVEIARKLLARLNPVFTGTSSITGLANFDCNSLSVPLKGGRPEEIAITGIVSMTDVKMSPTGLLGAILAAAKSTDDLMTLYPTPLTVRDGLVKYDNMRMDIGRRPFIFSGVVPVDPDRQIERFSVVLPVEGGITAYVKGTPNKPELDLGRTLLETGFEMLLESQRKK